MASQLLVRAKNDPFDAAEADLRIVLVGKTGSGKSTSGNTILGRKAFDSSFSASSVTSECQKERGEFEGQTLDIIDTPGLYDTQRTEEISTREISNCISLAAPGPHVFLIVIQANRFTEEEERTVRIIQRVFGDAAAAYTMVLFTHGDDLNAHNTDIDTFINSNRDLRNLVGQCQGGHHIFNNRDKDPSQVRELLEKIHRLVQRNGGNYYSNEMFELAQREIRRIIVVILNQNPGMPIWEARRQAEREYSLGVLASTLTVSGAVLGSLMGPEGISIGAALGQNLATVAVNACRMQ